MADLERVAHALSDPLRLRILDLLVQARRQPCCSPTHPERPEAVCACDLAPQLGGMAPSKLAYHLGILRETGLVGEQRRGKWVYYTLDATALGAFARAVTERFVLTELAGGRASRVAPEGPPAQACVTPRRGPEAPPRPRRRAPGARGSARR